MRKPSVPSVIFIYTDSAAAVGPPVGLAQARPSYHYTDSAAAVGPPVGLAQARPNNAAAYYSDTRKALIIYNERSDTCVALGTVRSPLYAL